MVKLLGIMAVVTICFATEAAGQVYVPAPIQVPVPVNSSPITISREIGRIEAERAGRRNSRRRKRVNAAKSPTSNPPITKSPTSNPPSKSPTSTSPTTTPKVSVIDPPPSSADAKISNTTGLARQMPDIYGPYLANFSRVHILRQNDQLSSTSGAARKRSVGEKATTQAASSLSARDTAFHASQPPFVPQEMAARLGKTQQERQYIEGILTKCLNYYIDNARRKGVPLNDVTRALNYFISTNYFIYTLGAGPTPDQMSATREVIRARLTKDDVFLQMSDKQKQEAYETLIVLASFTDYGFGTSKQSGDTNAAAQFREMAKYNLETLLGAPIEKIHFTNEGLAFD